MRTSKITINPALAEKILSKRDAIELPTEAWKEYAAQMTAGTWGDEDGVIILSSRDKSAPLETRKVLTEEDYTLFDGHNRMNAVIESGKEIDFEVVILNDDDWKAVAHIEQATPVFNSIVLSMRMSEEKEIDVSEFFELFPNFLKAYQAIKDNFSNMNYLLTGKPRHLLLGKTWVLAVLLHIFTAGNFEEQDDVYDAAALTFLKLLVFPDDAQAACDELNMPSEEVIKCREIAKQNIYGDRVAKCREIISLYREFKENLTLKLSEAV